MREERAAFQDEHQQARDEMLAVGLDLQLQRQVIYIII